MTAREALQELVDDPGGAYPHLRRALVRKQAEVAQALVQTTPDPATAYAKLHAAHTLWLEYERLKDPKLFVEHFAEKPTSGG